MTHQALVGDLGIERIESARETERTRHGSAFHDTFHMSNGIYYRTVTLIPQKPMTDIPLDIRTPWFTTEKGHNRRTAEAASASGIPVRLFAPPRINIDKHPRRFASSVMGALCIAQGVSMDADVAAYAIISNQLDDMYRYSFEPGVSTAYGESRGAMEGLGAMSLGHIYGRKLLWLEAVDPCVPDELRMSDLVSSPKSVSEVVAALRTLQHLTKESRFYRYLDTVDLSIDCIIPTLATKKTLFSGRAGDFAEHSPSNGLGHATYFDSSVANGYQSFKDKTAHIPGFSNDILKGGHLTLAAREIIYRSLARLVAVRDAIARHGEDFGIHELEQIRSARGRHQHKIKSAA